jgi:hypothetical protein
MAQEQVLGFKPPRSFKESTVNMRSECRIASNEFLAELDGLRNIRPHAKPAQLPR